MSIRARKLANFLILYTLASILFAAIPGCGSLMTSTMNTGEQFIPHREGELEDYVYPGKVFDEVIVPEQHGIIVSEVKDNSLTLLGNTESVKPGTVLVSDQGEGYLRKVVDIDRHASLSRNLVVLTEEAGLLDVLQEADVHHFEPMNFEDFEDPDFIAEGVTINPMTEREAMEFYERRGISGLKAPAGARVPSAKIGLPIHVGIESVLEGPGGTRVSASGTFDFEMGIELLLKIKFKKLKPYLDHFKFGPYAESEFELALNAEKTLEVSKTVKLYSKKFVKRKITITIARVPLVFIPEYSLYLDVSGNIKAAVTMAYTVGFSMETGIQYKNGNWSTYKSFTKWAEFAPPTLEVGGGVAIALENQLALLLYSVAGPYVSLTTPTVEVNAAMSFHHLDSGLPDLAHPDKIFLEALYNMYFSGGMKVKFLKKTLYEWKLPYKLGLLGSGVKFYEHDIHVFEYAPSPISGAVQDELGNPLANVRVTFSGPQSEGHTLPQAIRSGPDGRWSAEVYSTPGGEYRVSYSEALAHHGFPTQTFDARFGDSEPAQLPPAAGIPNTIGGTLEEPNGNPLADIPVEVSIPYYYVPTQESSDYFATTTTDSAGEWEVTHVPFHYMVGQHSVRPIYTGWHFEPLAPVITPVSGAAEVSQSAFPNTAFGIVQDEDGNGLADITIQVNGLGPDGEFSLQALSNPAGEFRVLEIPNTVPGEADHRISASSDQGLLLLPRVREFRLTDRDYNAGLFTSETMYSTFGNIVDYQGVEMPDVRVELSGAFGGETVSGENGDWLLEYSLRKYRNYRVEPVKPDWWFDPPYHGFFVEEADVPGLDFVAYPIINAMSVLPVGYSAGTGTLEDPFLLASNTDFPISVQDMTGDNVVPFCEFDVLSEWFGMEGNILSTAEYGPPAEIRVTRDGDPNSPISFWVMVWE